MGSKNVLEDKLCSSIYGVLLQYSQISLTSRSLLKEAMDMSVNH